MGPGMMGQGMMGPGMMGPGMMGPGMMGQGMPPHGPGYGSGWGPGYGYGVGPGWGMGPGMMAPPGAGYRPIGPGMMGPGMMGQGMVYGRVGPSTTPGMAPGMGPGNTAYGGPSARLDTDGDGRITADEAAAEAEAVFTALDADDDDMLTPEEFGAVPTSGNVANHPAILRRRFENRSARFEMLDADGDGRVDRTEFIGHAEGRFAEADTDADGFVSPWEWRSGRRW
jgi:hypothetical protein